MIELRRLRRERTTDTEAADHNLVAGAMVLVQILWMGNRFESWQSWITGIGRVPCESQEPRHIPVNHRTEFHSRVFEWWSYRQNVQLDCIQPVNP